LGSPLDLKCTAQLQLLQRETERFCRDPVNVQRRRAIEKFYDSLVLQARKIFRDARTECSVGCERCRCLWRIICATTKPVAAAAGKLTKINDNTASIRTGWSAQGDQAVSSSSAIC
jgi:hypothetical protein